MYADFGQTSGEQLDPVTGIYYQSEFLLHFPHDSTVTSPGAIDTSPYYPVPFPGLPMEGSAPESPTLFHMPDALPILQDNTISNITSPTVDNFTPGAPQQLTCSHDMLLQVSDLLSAPPSQSDPPTLPSQIDITTPRDPKMPWCPACGLKLYRWRDRDRHILTHLPHWIHCPLPHCAWRGNRVKSIAKHWMRQDHLPYHESYGLTPRLEQFQIFDPQEFVNLITAGIISASDAAVLALIIVGVKAKQLQKSSML
jgi:hypothetical protein